MGPSGHVYRCKSFFCLRPHDEPRKTTIKLVEHPAFDPAILSLILFNCITLAWESPLDPRGTAKAAFIDACDWLFLAAFTGELLVKVIAFGFVMHEGSYLRDAWCQLDFVIVSLAWVPLFVPSVGNTNAFRAIRALRPLRALKRVPGMPVLVKSITDALPRLATVAALCGAVLLVFGIVGVEMFKGSLHHHCTPIGGADGALTDHKRLDPNNFRIMSYDVCNPDQVGQCGEGMQCLYYAALPKSGTMSFDSVGGALIALLQAVTYDDYDEAMHALQASTSSAAFVYFVMVIVLCGFFIIKCAPADLEPLHEQRCLRSQNG